MLLHAPFRLSQRRFRVKRQTVRMMTTEEHRLPSVIPDTFPNLPSEVSAFRIPGENAMLEILQRN